MLVFKEKQILGHLPNWTYEERPQGIKVISLPVDTLLVLSKDPCKRERLANLIAFDTYPPLYFEVLGTISETSQRYALQSLMDELKESVGGALRSSKVVYPIRITWPASPDTHSQPHLGLRLLHAIDFDTIDDLLQTPFGCQHKLASSVAEFLCQIQVKPGGTGHLAECFAGLLDERIVHFSITIDPYQDWYVEDFTEMETQWYRILTMAREKLTSTAVTIAECRRIQTNKEYFCQPGLKRVFLDTEGNFWPCQQFYEMRNSNSSRIGNLNQGILESENHPFITFDAQAMEDCYECLWNLSCHNKCLWSNYRQSGTFYRTSGVVCAHEKAIRNAMQSKPFTAESNTTWDDYLELFCPHQQ